MAKETVEVTAKVGVNGAKSLADLKREFKDLQKELSGLDQNSEKYRVTLKKLGAVKDEIGDLRSEIEGFAGADKKVAAFSNVIGGVASGFQAAQGAAALFGSESEDLQKTLVRVQAAMAFAEGIKGIAAMGDSFMVLGNIIKANPIMLIATILIAIGAALFALKDKISIVGKAFDFFGGIINTVIDSVKTFTDWIGISSFKADEANEKLIRNAEKAINAGNTELALKNLKMLEKVEGPANKLLKTAQNWTSNVDTAIDRIPNMGGLLSGFKKALQSWVNLFSSASRRSMGVRRLMVNKTPQEQMKLVQGLEAALKREKFLDPTILGKPNILKRFLYGGGLGLGRFSDLFGKSSLRTRILMGQTKFYLGFLDKLGVGNFVGPEELSQQMGEKNLRDKITEYSQTPEGQKNWTEDMSSVDMSQQTPTQQTITQQAITQITTQTTISFQLLLQFFFELTQLPCFFLDFLFHP
jgi:phage shock protein A